jgi:hypothetical protein
LKDQMLPRFVSFVAFLFATVFLSQTSLPLV